MLFAIPPSAWAEALKNAGHVRDLLSVSSTADSSRYQRLINVTVADFDRLLAPRSPDNDQ